MNSLTKAGIAFAALLLLLFTFYLACLNHVEINEIGVAYNSIGGKVIVQSHPGWYFTSPMVRVATISMLPHKVTIPSEAVVINTKIVRFNPAGIEEFIRLQGFSYYTEQGIESILMGYAFSGHHYPFLDEMQASGDEVVTPKPLNQ